MRYVFVDRITSFAPPARATGLKCVSLSDDVFGDHFPTSPLWPGALLIESLAQLAGALLDASAWEAGRAGALSVLAVVHRAKFRRPVRPGDVVELEVETLVADEDRANVRATARVAGELAADAELGFVFNEGHHPELLAARRRLLEVWRFGLVRPT